MNLYEHLNLNFQSYTFLPEPFLIDPKDKYGQLIGGDVEEEPLRWWYFAEAYGCK